MGVLWEAGAGREKETELHTWIKLVSEFSFLIKKTPDLFYKAPAWQVYVCVSPGWKGASHCQVL